MIRRISKIAVLGAGVMGSKIACHFANLGIDTLLLDLAPEEEISKNNGEEKVKAKMNRIVNSNLQAALKSIPYPLYKAEFIHRITTGNYEDNLKDIASCDWILEVIIENLDAKIKLYEDVEKFRKPGTLTTTCTSGILVNQLIKGRSEDFQKNFCGTHFFNPPRLLKLLEIVPSKKTDPQVLEFLTDYSIRFLGKIPVTCKDTPAFIANRIGAYSMMSAFHLVDKMKLTVEETDALTGPIIGRPKSATFRTIDVVGLDTLTAVAKELQQNCPEDEAYDLYKMPEYVTRMVDEKLLGDKTRQGFYKKLDNGNGSRTILSLDLKTLEYKEQQAITIPSVIKAKKIKDSESRIRSLISSDDKAGKFYNELFVGLFLYVSHKVSEISDKLYEIDEAMKSGYGWIHGPFEIWDLLGVQEILNKIEKNNLKAAPWVYDMLENGITSFYKLGNGVKKYYDIASKKYEPKLDEDYRIKLDFIRPTNTLWENEDASILDMNDGIINLEFHSNNNVITRKILEGINKAIDMAEENYDGLVISNEGKNFSAGVDISMILSFTSKKNWEGLEKMHQYFQSTILRARYSSIPVITLPHGMTLAAGCELCMHSDKVIANAETYMGLVEFGLGLIPTGGGITEFAIRLADELKEGDSRLYAFQEKFMTILKSKVSANAHMAFDLGYLRKGIDEVYINKEYQLKYAKVEALQMAEKGYTKPVPRRSVKVLGEEALGIVYHDLGIMHEGHFITDHDKKIAEQLGWVLSGGDLSYPQEVREDYLWGLERETFNTLCKDPKTIRRLAGTFLKRKLIKT